MSEMFSSPTLITRQHNLEDFYSGEETLDDWLRKHAFSNMENLATKTYVICPIGSNKIIGYYAICMGQIFSQEVIGSMRRNMPKQIPAVILGRLAVDEKWQSQGVGKALLLNAIQRSNRASKEIAARLLIVHAISLRAELFYQRYGFRRLPAESPTYALDLVKLDSSQANRFV